MISVLNSTMVGFNTPALAYSAHHQAAIREMPLERILVETDCPVSYRGKISEPAHITSANAGKFFGL